MEINSIKDLIDALEELREPKEGHTRFFRGHSNAKKYKLKPSIYRKDNKYYHNEDNIIRDAIINNPDEFSDKDTLFDTLVKLQHYGYPTRLLDLTSNLLVAAYFAVRNVDEDGEIIVFDIPNNDIKYFDSDTVSVLSAISLRSDNFSIEIDDEFLNAITLCKKADYLLALSRYFKLDQSLSEFKNYIEEIKDNNYIGITPITTEKVKDLENEIKIHHDTTKKEKDFYIKRLREIKEKTHIEYFNTRPQILKLLHDIQKDKPEFRPIINKKDLERVICVKPKLNNKRIMIKWVQNNEEKQLRKYADEKKN